jgi:hypothetical protein
VISRVSVSLIMCTGGAVTALAARPAFQRGFTFALIVGDMVSQTNAENHMLAVGNLRMTAGAAEQSRDVLGKALLAAQPTPGPAN